MKWTIVLVPFPFDDLSGQKLRPALCLTNEIGIYQHIVIAFITSQVLKATENSDIHLLLTQADFSKTGLKLESAIRLHRLITIPSRLIQRQLGALPTTNQIDVEQKLKTLFDL